MDTKKQEVDVPTNERIVTLLCLADERQMKIIYQFIKSILGKG